MKRTDYTPAKYVSPNHDNIVFGPAMKALNPRQQALVEYMFDNPPTMANGQHNWTAMVRAVGYEGNDDTLRVTASRLRRDPKIGLAIAEVARQRPSFDLPMALGTIRTIASDPSHKDAGKMALALAGMSGISPVTRTEHKHEHVVTVDPLAAMEAKLALLPEDVAEQLRALVMPASGRKMIDVTPEKVQVLGDTEELSEDEVDELMKDFL